MRSKVVLVLVHCTYAAFVVLALLPSIGSTNIVRGLLCLDKRTHQRNQGRNLRRETCTRLGRELERRMWLADWAVLDRESRIYTHIFCRGSSTWYFYRSSNVVLDWVCHSSCSACSFSLPSAAQLRRDQLTWIRHSFLPMWWNASSWGRIEVQVETATVEFDHYLHLYQVWLLANYQDNHLKRNRKISNKRSQQKNQFNFDNKFCFLNKDF